MSDQTMTGRVVGDAYRITGFQRPGRMGDIYVGRRLDNNDIVSIKMLDPAMFGESEAIRRFERETKITTRLNHPCSLVVLDYGRTGDGLPFMVTEFVEGELLSDLLEEAERLPAERAAYLGAQIAMALDAAHAINVIHRDLAPTNILVTDAEGQPDSVKVIEFGLSRLTEGDDGENSTLTAVGVRIGTPHYMAPEYIEEYNLDHRADLYSLGIVMFEMLTGSPPFTGRPYKVMDKHLTEEPKAPSAVVDGVPEWLDQLVLHLLEKDPAARPQTGSAVAKVIEEGLGQRFQTVQAPDAPPTPVQEVREVAPEPKAALLDGFMDSLIREMKTGQGSVDPKDAYVVHRVATVGVAARAGVKRGWLCGLPDEPVSGMRPRGLWRTPVERRRYVFADPESGRSIELSCSGAEIGVDLVRGGAHIRAHYNPVPPDDDALLELWLQGDWETLEALSMRSLSQQRGAAGILNTGLFARFLGSGGIKERAQPALVLHGAALIEQGKVNEGNEQVREYALEHSHRFHQRFNGLAQYYEAAEIEKMGNDERAVELYLQSWLMYPNKRTADRIHQLTGKVPDTRNWYGRQFPDYTLDCIDNRIRTVSLYKVLATMEPHQVLVVVMLAGERANEAYSEVVQRYHAYAPFFGDYLMGLHVVTDEPIPDGDAAQWLAAEQALIEAGATVEVLEDYKGFLRRAIKPQKSPVVFGINRRGLVVHEGELDGVGLWDMLADTAKLAERG